MAGALWSLVGLPALAGLALLVLGRRAESIAAPCAVAVATVGLGLGVTVAIGRPEVSAPMLAGIPVGLAVDGLSAAMVSTVAAVFLAVIVFAAGELGPAQARARFFGLMSLFAAAMLSTVTATNLLALLAAWEIMGATSYALIAYWWRDSHRVRSGTLAFLTTRTADLGMYLAAGAALAGGAATLELSGLAGLDSAWRAAAVAGLVIAALGKSAQLPLSFWLSHAMAGPSPVSALLHSATMVAAGGYLLLRLEPALAATAWAGAVVAWIGVLTALLLGAVAFVQTDLKQLLAASTCSQIGFIVLAAGAGGVAGGALQFVAHASAKSLLFLCAGAWLGATGTQNLEALRGVARHHPLVGAAFSVGVLAIGGLPPLSGWVAKDEVLASALHASPALYVTGLAASVVSAAYAAKALVAVWSPSVAPAPNATRERAAVHVSLAERLPLPVLAAAAAAAGVLALPVLAPWWRATVGTEGEPGPGGWEIVVSGALSAGVLAGAAWLGARRGSPAVSGVVPGGWLLGDWLATERGIRASLVRPVSALSHGLAAFDDRVVTGGVRACAAVGVRSARQAEARVEIRVDRAVRAVAAGARVLALWSWRPQTGLLHQYYAQAVTALVLLTVVAVLSR